MTVAQQPIDRSPLWLRLFFFGAAYYLCAFVGDWLTYESLPIVRFWFPSGLYVGALLLHRREAWPRFVIAAMIVNLGFSLSHGRPVFASFLFATGNSLEALAGASLVRYFVGERVALKTMWEALGFVWCSAIVSTMISATVGALTLEYVLGEPVSSQTWLLWWTGDAAGVLLIGTLVLVWGNDPKINPKLVSRPVEMALVLSGVMGATWMIFRTPSAEMFFRPVIVLPFFFWAVLRFSLRGVSIITLISALLTASQASRGLGGFVLTGGLFPLMERAMALHVFVIVTTLCSIVTSVVLGERRAIERRLRQSEATARCLLDAPGGIAFLADSTGRIIDANRHFQNQMGDGLKAGTEQPVWAILTQAGVSLTAETFSQVVTERKPVRYETRNRDAWLEVLLYPVTAPTGEVERVALLAMDISERKRAEEDRVRLANELKQKNRELENVLYAASHDLRSPLLNAQGFSRRLQQSCDELAKIIQSPDQSEASRARAESITKEQIPKALHYINSSIIKMDVLINGLLRMSRLGHAKLREEELNVNQIVAQCVAAMAFQIQKSEATVETGSLPPCVGDAAMINQVFSNFLDNALKYRDPARPLRIHITGRQENGRSLYCVEDTGMGIRPDQQEKIWELFCRLDPSGPVGGDGLGLSLVRRIIERHDGRVWIQSEAGQGSRFFFELPSQKRSVDTTKEST